MINDATGLVSSGDAAVLLDESGLGRHDNDVQLQLASSQLLQVWTRRRSRGGGVKVKRKHQLRRHIAAKCDDEVDAFCRL